MLEVSSEAESQSIVNGKVDWYTTRDKTISDIVCSKNLAVRLFTAVP